MPIGRASDPVVGLAIFDRQQPHDHIRPQRNTHLWPTPWHHDRLINSEPMSRHGGYLGWSRTDGNLLWPALSTSEELSCSYGVRLSKSASFLQNGKASVHRACRSCLVKELL